MDSGGFDGKKDDIKLVEYEIDEVDVSNTELDVEKTNAGEVAAGADDCAWPDSRLVLVTDGADIESLPLLPGVPVFAVL